LEKAELGEF
jgi:hypothetical protein